MTRWLLRPTSLQGKCAIGAVAACAGLYTLALAIESLWGLVHVLWGLTSPLGLAAIGIVGVVGIYVAAFGIYVVFTAFLFRIAAWGLEPRRRWRDWRYRSHPGINEREQ
ncbi:MAG: hypothetical protein WKF55_02180 [Gemmatimonadaceae bacterium]